MKNSAAAEGQRERVEDSTEANEENSPRRFNGEKCRGGEL